MLPIIVITPVKNEAWILPLFLEATLKFANHIIIADQSSTDNSTEIIKQFERTTLIKNPGSYYSEDSRQKLLIDSARKLFPGPKVIFALDADEIISGDSFHANDWKIIKESKPNTVFYFEKPELYKSYDKTIRYRHNLYPLAFVDNDTLSHSAKKIHSIRIPLAENGERKDLTEITFLHASYLRPLVQRAKYRFYSVQENDLGTSPWYRRRRRYKNPNHLLFWEPVENSPDSWFQYPPDVNIDFSTITDTGCSWYDIDIMECLAKRGGIKYWLDDIWDQEWNKLLTHAGFKKIWKQPNVLKWLLKKADAYL